MTVDCCLSPHEQQLQDRIAGKTNKYRETHKRVFKILDTIENLKPVIDVERAKFFTESMMQTEGEHLPCAGPRR